MQVQLAAGSLDVGVFGAIGLATLVRRGSDITLFGPALNNHGRIIVKADSPFHQPSDLVGKKIATQPKTTETYQQARVALSLLGIDIDRDFETFFRPPTANLALFDRGDVDAVIIIEPTATRAIGSGRANWRKLAISGGTPPVSTLRRSWWDWPPSAPGWTPTGRLLPPSLGFLRLPTARCETIRNSSSNTRQRWAFDRRRPPRSICFRAGWPMSIPRSGTGASGAPSIGRSRWP
jgi:hypothetical protein